MKIKMLVMDVDGTLTDGAIYISPNGEAMKAFNVKDGYGIVQLRNQGIIPVIITGRKSQIVGERAKELKITELYQGIHDKLTQLKEVAEKYNVTLSEIAYIGDDLNDLECMEHCGFVGCPADAVDEVIAKAHYVCKHEGGKGAVREFIEQFAKF